MPPASGVLGEVYGLDEGKADVELGEGAHPVGAVENEVAVAVGGDDDGVALNGLAPDAFTYPRQTRRVVVFVKDQARKLDDREGVESRDHAPGHDPVAEGLGVAAGAGEDEVEKQEAAEKEQGDYGEKPYDAHEQVQRIQKKGLQHSLRHTKQTRKESGRPDSNRRPLGPQPSALPDCATSRRTPLIYQKDRRHKR